MTQIDRLDARGISSSNLQATAGLFDDILVVISEAS